LLSANHGHLIRDLKNAEAAGISRFHFDVCDGHYTDNIIFGDQLVKDVRKETSSALDVHLAVYNMAVIVKRFLCSGADSITVQYESSDGAEGLLDVIKGAGVKAGICFTPVTRFEEMEYYLDKADIVNILAVNPGEGGQSFNKKALKIIELTAGAVNRMGLSTTISVDGGLNCDTVGDAANAGADIVIVGSGVFCGDIFENIKKLKGCVEILRV
jgi:ribulose-phosphate 3-epimerase